MPTSIPGNKEIVAAKTALQELLATRLLNSATMSRFVSGLPPEERLSTLPAPAVENIVEDLKGYLTSSVQFLLGRLSQSQPEAVTEMASVNLEHLLLAFLALQPDFQIAEEHYLLLADFYRRHGRLEEATSLLGFLAQPAGAPN